MQLTPKHPAPLPPRPARHSPRSKTQNLFLTAAGVIKLGDFGVSRVLNGTHQMAHTQVGTPYYLSPEICENRPYNAKSDVWSLGCVLYELTTFRHAFDAASLKLLVLKIVRGIYTPVPATRYSKGMRDLVTAMLQKDPSKRPGINRILERPIVQRRVAKFLSPGEIEGAQAEAGAQALEGKRSPLDVRSAACVATASPESVRTNSAQRKPPLPPEARVLSAAAAAKAIALPGGGGIARPSSAGSRQAGTPTDAHAGGGVITKAPNAVAVAARRKRERECDKESRYSEALAALQRRTEERMRAEAAQRNREAEDARLRAERASRHRMLAQKSAERRAAAAAAREAKAQALTEARREMMVAGRRQNAAANAEGAVRPAEVQIFAAPMRGAGTPAASKMAAAHAAPTARTLQAGAGKRVCVGSSVQTGPPVIAIAAAAPTAAERRAAYEDIRSAAARNRAACQRDLSGQPTEIEANVGTNAAVGSSVALHAAEAMQHGAQRVEQGSNSDGESPDEVRVRRERDREAAAEARKAELAAAMRADLGEARAAARRNRCNVHADLCRWSCNQESDADDAARAIGQEGIRDAATSSEGGAAYQLKPQRAVDAGEGEVMGGVDAGEGGTQDDGCETGEEAAARAVSAARAEAEAAADLDSAEREAVLAEMRAAVLGARCPEYGRGLPDDDDDVDGSEPWTPPFPKFILGEAEVVLPNVSDDDTVSTRAEALRLYLEDTVTTQNFLEAYHIMDGLRAGDDEDDACVRVSKALGGNAEVATLIQQLIVCEDTLCNANVNDDPRGGA